MFDIRCSNCNKLLGRAEAQGQVEIKCPRCKKLTKETLNIITEYTNLDKENERIRQEIEKEMYYVTEDNIELEKAISEGRQAEKKLQENREQLKVLMTTYLGVEA